MNQWLYNSASEIGSKSLQCGVMFHFSFCFSLGIKLSFWRANTKSYTYWIHLTALFCISSLLQLQWKQDLDKGLELISKAIEIDNKCDFAYETMGTIEVQRYFLEFLISVMKHHRFGGFCSHAFDSQLISIKFLKLV